MEELFIKKLIELLNNAGWEEGAPTELDADSGAAEFLVYPNTCIGIRILDYNERGKLVDYELGVISAKINEGVRLLHANYHRTVQNATSPTEAVNEIIKTAKDLHASLKQKFEATLPLINQVLFNLNNLLTNGHINGHIIPRSHATYNNDASVKNVTDEVIGAKIRGESSPDVWGSIECSADSEEYNGLTFYLSIEVGISVLREKAILSIALEGQFDDINTTADESKELEDDLDNGLLDAGAWTDWASDGVYDRFIEIDKKIEQIIKDERYYDDDGDDYDRDYDRDYDDRD